MRATGSKSRSRLLWRYGLAFGACLVLGWFAFVRETRVPVLWYADLGFHELGHLVFALFPQRITALGGNGLQFAVPLGLAVYFGLWRRDFAPAAVCSAWAGTSAQDASVYIADAPYENLELIGGEHDWAFLLGPDGFDVMEQVVGVTRFVHDLGFVLVLAGLVLCVLGLWLDAHAVSELPAEHSEPADTPPAPPVSWDDRFPTRPRAFGAGPSEP